MADDDPVSIEGPSADDELRSLDLDLNDDTEEIVLAAPTTLGRSLAFDFVSRRFIIQPNAKGPVQTFGDDTLYALCIKALHTASDAHEIYTNAFGMVNANRWTGRRLNGSDLAELENAMHTALTNLPRVSNVVDFEFDFDEDAETLSFSCAVIKDDDTSLIIEDVPLDSEET